MHRIVSLLSAVGLLSAFVARSDDPRLTNRLDERTRAAVSSVIEEARRDGVPTDLLVSRALEGASKQAPSAMIVAAVRSWATDLRRAKQALGPASSAAEIEAGASALRAGIQINALEQFRQAKGGVRIASALDAMSYLVNSGVPADTISSVVVKLVLASASEEQLTALQRDIARDIAGGLPAATAASLRGQGLVQQIAQARTTGNGAGPGTALPSARGQARAVDVLTNPGAVGSVQGTSNVSGEGGRVQPPPRGKPKKP